MKLSSLSGPLLRAVSSALAVFALGAQASPIVGPLDDPSQLYSAPQAGGDTPSQLQQEPSVPPSLRVDPTHVPPINSLHVLSIVRESSATCDFSRAGRRGGMGTPVVELLKFEHLQAVKPEMGLIAAGAIEFAARHSVRVCFDQKLKGTPYSSALHLPSGTIALNPEPSYFNSPAVQELALMDALEHMGSMVAAAKRGVVTKETLLNVQLIRMDPDKPDASKREFSAELTLKYPPPLRPAAPWAPVTRPILPKGPTYKT